MGWLANKLGRGQGATSYQTSPDDRWGALLVPRELVEEHPRSLDRAFLLVRYTVVAAIITVLFAPYYFFYLKLPFVLVTNVLYGISLAITLVILRQTRSLRIAANWTLSAAFAVLLVCCCCCRCLLMQRYVEEEKAPSVLRASFLGGPENLPVAQLTARDVAARWAKSEEVYQPEDWARDSNPSRSSLARSTSGSESTVARRKRKGLDSELYVMFSNVGENF